MKTFSIDRQDVIVRRALNLPHSNERAGALTGAGLSEFYDLGVPEERVVASVRAAYAVCRLAESTTICERTAFGGVGGKGEPS